MKNSTLQKPTTKTVHIIARVQFKQTGYITYKVRSSKGNAQYTVTVSPEGDVKSCDCPANKPCYHMTGIQAIEDARREGAQEVKAPAKVSHRQLATVGVKGTLNGNTGFNLMR